MTDMIDDVTGELIVASPQQQTHQFLLASANTEQVWTALLRAQAVIEMPQRTKTGKVQGRGRSGNEYAYEYKYAPLEEILDKVRQPMIDESLGKQQYLAQRGGMWVMRTVIFHSSGQWVGCDYPIFWDEAKGAQGFGSGVTYARRYGLMLVLGLAAEDDDDGAEAPAPARAAAKSSAEPASMRLEQSAWAAARSGSVALADFWEKILTKDQRVSLGNGLLDKLKATAGEYDASRANGGAE